MPTHENDLQDFARQPDGSFRITGDMIIGDVVMAFPQAIPIMLSHGLHCVGCHANAFDTVEDGSRGHGMPEEEILRMIEEINAAINRKIENIEMTAAAIAKVRELRGQETGKEDWPLRITATRADCCGVSYEMDFGQERDGDIAFMCGDLKVIVDPESFPLLKGSSIDYVESLSASGFRIDNPNAKKGCDC